MGWRCNLPDLKTGFSSLLERMALLLVFLLAGCASAPMDSEADYPKSFPKPASSAGACPAISGTISNQGAQYNPETGQTDPAVLSRDVLNLPDAFAQARALTVTLDEAAVPGLFGPIKVYVLHVATDSGADWRTPKEKSICANGMFQYIVKEDGWALPVGFGMSSDPISFFAAVDGSLVIRRAHLETGIAFIVPYKHRSSTSYYRFPVDTGQP